VVKAEPEYATPPVNRRRGGNCLSICEPARQQHGRAGGALLILKPEVKEELDDEEAAKAVQLAEYERQQCLIASSEDPDDCPGLHMAFASSLDNKDAWGGDLDLAIAMSIRDSGSHSSTSPTTARLDQPAR
jgi:hypothetical protein